MKTYNLRPKNILAFLALFILTCIFIASLQSCNAVKKISSKQSVKYDSAGQKSLTAVDVSAKDSAGKSESLTTTSKASDSGYKKTTVVKEYYSDEFDLGNDTSSITTHSSIEDAGAPAIIGSNMGAPFRRGIVYRETTITEEGKLQRNENQVQKTEQASTTHEVDSSNKIELQASTVKGETVTKNSTKVSKPFSSIISGLMILIIVAGAAYSGYQYFRKSKV